MTELHWTGYVSVATPIIVVLLGWLLHQKSERRWKATEQRWKEEERLHPDRIEVYNEALEPYIVLLMSESEWAAAQDSRPEYGGMSRDEAALASVFSLAHRRNSFKLMLIGGDEVVRAYNDLTLFHSRPRDAPMTEAEWEEGLRLFGRLVLAIRRSVGNEGTKLDAWDMLYWGWSNVEEIRAKHRP
ncbi:MAG: hypothetical protein OXR83_00555 [Acidobacteriota bacterium]|nr:hypothetical protein [Acidobacteriota bacterium]